MRLTCPWCGTRDIEEFFFGGDASVERPEIDETDPSAWHDYLYARSNPAGRHREFWHHERGCRRWLIVERDTCSHAVSSVQFADEANR